LKRDIRRWDSKLKILWWGQRRVSCRVPMPIHPKLEGHDHVYVLAIPKDVHCGNCGVIGPNNFIMHVYYKSTAQDEPHEYVTHRCWDCVRIQAYLYSKNGYKVSLKYL
jgi:hypothetical protein